MEIKYGDDDIEQALALVEVGVMTVMAVDGK
jgi:hypothetical protein